MMVVTLMAGLASTIFFPIEAWLIELQGWRTGAADARAFLAVTTILPHALLLRRRPEDIGQHLDGDPTPHAARAVGREGEEAVGRPRRCVSRRSAGWLWRSL